MLACVDCAHSCHPLEVSGRLATDEDRAAQATARLEQQQCEAEAAVGAVGAEAAEEAEEEAEKEAEDPRERWLGKLRRSMPRYRPSTLLQPGVGRWGAASDLLEAAFGATGRVQELQDKISSWEFARRVGYRDYNSSNFIVDAHRWNVQCQKQLTKGTVSATHAVLVSDIPERFQSAIGDHNKEINDMVRNHEGEVREIDGSWVQQAGAPPTLRTHPALFHCQYALTRQEYLALHNGYTPPPPDPSRDPERRYNNILAAPAVGGGGGGAFLVRVCRIISLAELFWFWGTQYTARELYTYYVHSRRFHTLCVSGPSFVRIFAYQRIRVPQISSGLACLVN